MMERRKIDVMCVQEVRWKGSKAREIGANCELYYIGSENKKNGVGIILRRELKKTLVEVIRMNDRLMAVRVQCKERMLFIVSAYAPQCGRNNEEMKQEFRENLLALTARATPDARRFHRIGVDRIGFEECMGKFGYGRQN